MDQWYWMRNEKKIQVFLILLHGTARIDQYFFLRASIAMNRHHSHGKHYKENIQLGWHSYSFKGSDHYHNSREHGSMWVDKMLAISWSNDSRKWTEALSFRVCWTVKWVPLFVLFLSWKVSQDIIAVIPSLSIFWCYDRLHRLRNLQQ